MDNTEFWRNLEELEELVNKNSNKILEKQLSTNKLCVIGTFYLKYEK